MTSARPSNSDEQHKSTVSLRDWFLLPLLGLLTIALLAGSLEMVARRRFPQSSTLAEDCMVFTDPTTGPRGIPNSVCWEKIAEGEWTENRFNSCGHRAGMECGPKPPGEYRIVMIGTSMAMGMRVPREKTLAALLPRELSRRTGMKIELYDEALPYRTPDIWANHFDEVLKAQPDMILWALNPKDMTSHVPREMIPRELNLSWRLRAWHHIKSTFASRSFSETVQYAFHHTRSAVLLLDALYSDPRQFVKSTLLESDSDIGYLRSQPSQEWKNRLEAFEDDVERIQARTESAKVPLVVTTLPSHVQADMVTLGEWPDGLDPYKLDDEVSAIVNKHGGIYLNILRDIRYHPGIQKGYYSLDVHANPIGNAIFSDALAKELAGSAPVSVAQQAVSTQISEAR